VLVPLRMMAERENAREKAMAMYDTHPRDLMRAEVKPDVVMSEANSGPMVSCADLRGATGASSST